MHDLSVNDFYDVKRMSLISDVDLETLIDFYLPLIGNNGLSIYLTLSKDISFYNGGKIQSHDLLLTKLGLSTISFANSMKRLEALSLVSTYYQKGKNNSYFTYCLYSPFDPKSFFANDILVTTLESVIGTDGIDALRKKYSSSINLEGFEDVSSQFADIYTFRKILNTHKNNANVKGKISKKIKETFDLQVFSANLKEYGRDINYLSKEELTKIRGLSNFYLIDSKKMADLVSKYFVSTKEEGKRVNFSSLERDCRMSIDKKKFESEFSYEDVNLDTDLGKKISIMDEMSPIKFLSFLQSGGTPSFGDIKAIEHLKLDLGLKDPVINGLVDYTLQKNNNVLSYAYLDKIGGSLARMNFSYSREVLDYLTSIDETMKKRSKKAVKKKDEADLNDIKKIEVAPEEEISDEEMAKLLEGL